MCAERLASSFTFISETVITPCVRHLSLR